MFSLPLISSLSFFHPVVAISGENFLDSRFLSVSARQPREEIFAKTNSARDQTNVVAASLYEARRVCSPLLPRTGTRNKAPSPSRIESSLSKKKKKKEGEKKKRLHRGGVNKVQDYQGPRRARRAILFRRGVHELGKKNRRNEKCKRVSLEEKSRPGG